jgi:hypothetical protein
MILDNTNKISVSTFSKYLINTSDEVWLGILKRDHANTKLTLKGWVDLVETIKSTI